MDIIDGSKIEIQPLSPEWIGNDAVQVDILRLDMIHPVVSGNKWYKLKHNLQQAKDAGYTTILTFGGAYSNHLVAAAAAAKAFGLASVGVVRGDDGGALTDTLEQCKAMGMQLHFVSREEYKRKEENVWLQTLSDQFHQSFIIPEGGANEWGRSGAEDIAALIPNSYSYVCVSVGTGTTFIGLRNALPAAVGLLGFAPMKGGGYLTEKIRPYLKTDTNWRLFDEWHFGGFGKSNEVLISFMNEFYKVNGIPLDVVYTGKMMYGIRELLGDGYFPGGSKVLCIHTGGLQGNSSAGGRLVY